MNMKKTARRLTAFLCLATFGMAVSASAAMYVGSAYEGFDYATGGVSGRGGGTGFNSTGDATIGNTTSWTVFRSPTRATVESGSLSYTATGYTEPTGNKLAVSGDLGSDYAMRNLGQAVATTEAGSMYFSFLMQKTRTSDRALNVAFFGGGDEVLSIGQTQTAPTANLGQLGVGIRDSVTLNTYYTDSAIALGSDVHLIIGKLQFNYSGTTDRLTLWVNPTDVTGGESSLTAYQTVDFESYKTTIDSIRPFAGGTSGEFGYVTGNFDEIRVGSSFASVIPEPATFGIVMSALAALIIRRKRFG